MSSRPTPGRAGGGRGEVSATLERVAAVLGEILARELGTSWYEEDAPLPGRDAL